jgi:hypothetical protein
MSVGGRLKRLESGGRRPCPECGVRLGEVLPVVVAWDEILGDADRELGSERCAGCGRYISIGRPEFPERFVRGGGGTSYEPV